MKGDGNCDELHHETTQSGISRSLFWSRNT